MKVNLIEFRINRLFHSYEGYFIYVDDGLNDKRRWLLPTGIVTSDSKLVTQLTFKSRADAERFLKNWLPAEGFMSKANVSLYAGFSECRALDSSIEHWKQVVLNVLEGDDHVGPKTCSLCVRSKLEIKKYVGGNCKLCCSECILNGYKSEPYRDSNHHYANCCADYEKFSVKASVEHAINMLNTLTSLRNDKYGPATYTQFGTIKNTTEIRSEYQQEGAKIVDDILKVKEPEFVIRGEGTCYIFREASSEYLCKDGKLNKMCTNGWYNTKSEAKAVLAKYQRTVVVLDEFDIQRLKARIRYGDPCYFAQHRDSKKYLCHDDKLHQYCGNGWYATSEDAVAAVKKYEHPEYQFRGGDIVNYDFGVEKRIIVDLGYYYSPNKRVLGAVDSDGQIRCTSTIGSFSENFKFATYKKVSALNKVGGFLLSPVNCPIIAGDVIVTPWDDLRFAVMDRKGNLRLHDFGGVMKGTIKKGDKDNFVGYHKVGRIGDYL